MCQHVLKIIGGSSNGRVDGQLASVYMCQKCKKYGYAEDFQK